MIRWLRASLIAAMLSVVAATAPPAQALGGSPLTTEVSSRSAEVGENIQVKLTVSLADEDERPNSPRLEVPAGFGLRGPSVGSSQQVVISGGRMRSESQYVATWIVTPSKPGRYTLGPASVLVNGRRLTDRQLQLEVFPAGSRPRRGAPFANPRAPFGRRRPMGIPGRPWFDFDLGLPDDPLAEPELPPHPPELDIDRARDPVAFLDARISKRRVVIGEQLNYQVFAYGSRGPFGPQASQGPSRADFLTHSVLEFTDQTSVYPIEIGDARWYAAQALELALFPLKAGELQVGPFEMTYGDRFGAYGRPPRSVVRKSQALTVSVSEPPLEGRPPGYRIGDVGRYELEAKVDPREIDTGSATSVWITLRGHGNLPGSLVPPERQGVSWLDPTVSSNIGVDRGRISGERKFHYIVRIERPGLIDLGTFELAYFDPARHRYSVARARLGQVRVTGAPPAAATATPSSTSTLALLPTRTHLGSATRRVPVPSDSPWFWWSVVGGPGAVLLARGLGAHYARLRRRLERRRSSAGRQARDALQRARTALAQQQPAKAATALESALFATIEEQTSLKARGMLRSDLTRALQSLGYRAEVAHGAASLLDELDSARFAGALADTTTWHERVEKLMEQLMRSRSRRRSST